MSFSSTLQIILSLSHSRMYTSIYAFEYFVNLNGELLNPGFVCGNCCNRDNLYNVKKDLKQT